MENDEIVLSTLPKTWIFDLAGTILKHNGYLIDGIDTVLPGAIEYFASIPKEDRIVIFTSRNEEYRQITLDFLVEKGIRFDDILFGMPVGERIVINDRKPSGIDMAIAINLDRNIFDVPKLIREK